MEKLLIRFFVDNLTLDKYWHCHQIQQRSFFVRGRQFHICARCTGIFIGYIFSPLLFFLSSGVIVKSFVISALIMAIDEFTQLWGWRESVNALRFITGLGFGLTFPPFCIATVILIFFR
ncbi:MAG: DUF2085 domain-containing protein [Synergistaceae bacterium]|nr:DUF2085 domain-containing protein [Synergistaceae bacterium]MBQ6002094.1 DUF2085 domain-containing protein [Synergistaceae bacterium]MBR0279226.1 DUF2085 domain-containing protein [Synergistaceae bacterium]